jgi:hypothetical protein
VAEAYAAIALVDGLRFTEESTRRLRHTQHLSQDERRAEVLRVYKKPRKSKPK